MVLLPLDFESSASASSAIPACYQHYSLKSSLFAAKSRRAGVLRVCQFHHSGIFHEGRGVYPNFTTRPPSVRGKYPNFTTPAR